MNTTMTLAANYDCSPFEILEQDTDDVIMLINYYIEIGGESESPKQTKTKAKEQRIRVNDKTATGGWW